MKRIVLLMAAVAFSTSMAAQTTPEVQTEDVEQATMEVTAEEVTVEDVAVESSASANEQIVEALKNDESLQKETINYLKENPDTSDALASIIEDNDESVSDIMNSVLGDSDLTAAAVNWISNNPEMLGKVMKLAGM
jgi:hypothetical protein